MPDKSRSESSSGTDKPLYNDNPLFLRGHLESLYEWLPETQANHLNLAGGYFMVSNRKTIVMSAEHSAAIKDGSLVTPTDFRATFTKPIDPKRWKITSTPLPSADEGRFSIQPEAIRTGLNEMLADIVGSFEDTESGKDAKREAGNCPITLLNQLKDEADNITNTMVGKIDDLMSKMMDDGLSSATLTGFSQFRKGYTSLNLALHDDETLSDAKLAKRFAKVVRGLGTVADTAMRFEMLKRTADGNLALTIKACKTVLGDMEANNDKGGALGAALSAGGRRDPAIFPSGGGGAHPHLAPLPKRGTLIAHSTPHATEIASTAGQVSIGLPTALFLDATQPKRKKLQSGRKGAIKRKLSVKKQLLLPPRQHLRHTGNLGAAAAQTIPLTPSLPPYSYRMQRPASRLHSRQVGLYILRSRLLWRRTIAQNQAIAIASQRGRRSMSRLITLARPKCAMGSMGTSRLPTYTSPPFVPRLPPVVPPVLLRTTVTTFTSYRGSRHVLRSPHLILTLPCG